MSTALAAMLLSTSAVANNAEQRLKEPAETVFGRATTDVALKTDFLKGIFGKEDFDWAADLEAGTITFSSRSKTVQAPVQVIGTYNSLDQTFLWGWDHPSVPPHLRADAQLARKFGRRNDLPLFTASKVDCTEEQAWQFTAVALYLSGAQGAYRGPAGTTMVFMTYGDLTIQRRKSLPREEMD